MADKKISQLNTASAVYDADDFALVQDAETKQVNASTVKAYVKNGLSKSDVGLGNVDNTSDATKNSAAVTLTNKTLISPAISGGTANNVAIGGTTPAAGSFTNLSYTGTLTGGTGVLNIGSGQIYKDASGNVGIGIASNGAKLHVMASQVSSPALGEAPKNLFVGVGQYYGTAFWTLGTGAGYIQQQRIDDTAVAYNLVLQPSGANVSIGVGQSGASAVSVLAIGTGTAPTSGPADTVQFYSSDRSAGNTIPSFYCEGSGVVTANTTAAATHRIAIRINGTIYYFLANTAA